MGKMLSVSKLCRMIVILVTIVVCVVSAQQTIEDAREERQRVIKKFLKKEEGAIKLVGGRIAHEGNVEILHNGKWGAICDDEWDKNEAEVVCRQLGYAGVEKFTHSGMFGLAKRKYWMDNIYCDGTEPELSRCRFDGWGENDCDSSEAAGVICKTNATAEYVEPGVLVKVEHPKYRLGNKVKVSLRLAGGRTHEEGRVEIRFPGSGSWGTICSDGWSLLEANVVCQQLGLGYALNAVQTDFFASSTASKIVLSGTECFGNETSIAHCIHHIAGRVHCSTPKNHVASVVCTQKMADLVFDYTQLETTAHLEDKPLFYLTCSMEENCLASRAYEIQKENPAWHLETRRLLKFTATTHNYGTADFRPSIPKHLWEWHMCHMHYHSMEVFATFDVIDVNGTKVAEGHKASFCLEDNQCQPGIEPKYACANYGDQGISVNCSDVYRYNLDCQWIDITEIDTGMYTLKIAINPEFKVPEMRYDNNAAVCTLMYTESYARIYNCRSERP